MCILISHPAATQFDYDDLVDFHDHNPDGIGVMWSEDNILHVRKTVPKNADEAWAFYNEYVKGKDAVLHLRLQTHGPTQVSNSHPFPIYPSGSPLPVYLAHNGVLHTGNDKDKSQTDTALYIADYLIPLTRHNPELLFDPVFMELVESHIGTGNKFIIMDHTGRQAVYNRDVFVEYKGALLSNTYAWNAEKGGYGAKRGWGKFSRGYPSPYATYEDDDYTWPTSYHSTAKFPRASTRTPSYLALPGDEGFMNFSLDDEASARGNETDDPVGFTPVTDEAAYEYWCETMFDALEDGGYKQAYRLYTYHDLGHYYRAVGEEQAYTLLGLIEECAVSDSDIIAEIDRALLDAAMENTEEQAA